MSRARRFAANRAAVVGAILVLALVLLAVLGPWLVAADPLARDLDHGLTARGAPLPPSAGALLGTDHLGRDVWARVLAGGRTSLWIASLATLCALAVGGAVGLVAGYAGGWLDDVLMRVVDLVLAFPALLLAILLAALLRETSLAGTSVPVILTLAIVGWTTMARVLRGKTRVLARSELVTAARALGARPARILGRHVLPNVLGAVIVLAALGFAQALLAEALLSYLGLGPAQPAPTWGRMLYEGRLYYRTAPHLVLVPGCAIVIAVMAIHLVGDGLRDAFDPKEPR